MKRVLPPEQSLALHDVAGTRAIEQRAMTSLGPQELMQRAGLAVARLALAIAPHARRFWVAAGPGNNGGDGLEAALHLHRWGKHVEVSSLADEASHPSDARAALMRACAAGVPVHTRTDIDYLPDLAIDALLGIGARRPPDLAMRQLILRTNAMPCPTLAVDVPSGLLADTGVTLGTVAVIATHTLSLLTLKPGLFTGSGRDHAGTVWWDDLGVTADAQAPIAWLAGLRDQSAVPARRHAQHKGSFGDVAAVGGAPGMAGAVWLAARAALAAGAGRVVVDALDAQTRPHDVLRPELMLRPGWAHSSPAILIKSLAVCGCGGGDAVRGELPMLLSHVPRLVLDADGLNAVSGDEQLRSMLKSRAARGHVTILTPHPLEAARLLGSEAAQVQADRLGAARQIAADLQCIVVLKGSGTVVAAPNRAPSINATGNAALASAGTGDVLAGWLAGCWSQFDVQGGAAAAFDAARAAVALHGQAAEHVSSGPLRASDLIERMAWLRAAG